MRAAGGVGAARPRNAEQIGPAKRARSDTNGPDQAMQIADAIHLLRYGVRALQQAAGTTASVSARPWGVSQGGEGRPALTAQVRRELAGVVSELSRMAQLGE